MTTAAGNTAASKNAASAERDLLRHMLATVAYRGAKTLRHAPPEFANFAIPNSPRTPLKILAHIGDLFDWALTIAKGQQAWNNAEPQSWDAEADRFFLTLRAFDDYLASAEPLHETPEKLFQGPISDALTHIGQLAMLRRISGAPMKGENYHKAEIRSGQVGKEQPTPRREFD
jgi:hypothetical protein